MRLSARLGYAIPLLLPGALAWACSSSRTSATPAAQVDAGAGSTEAGAPDVVVAVGEVKQTGRILAARAATPVENATITVGSKSATTGADGKYAIAVPKGTPHRMKIAGEGSYNLLEQEWILDKDTDRGDTSFLSKTLANILLSFFADMDKSKGVLTMTVNPRGCPSIDGAIVTLEPPGSAKVKYARGGIPSDEVGAKPDELPTAIFYNIEPGKVITVKVTHPSCIQLPYPIEADGFKLTGSTTTEGGESISYFRTYLGPGPTSDAGPADAAKD